MTTIAMIYVYTAQAPSPSLHRVCCMLLEYVHAWLGCHVLDMLGGTHSVCISHPHCYTNISLYVRSYLRWYTRLSWKSYQVECSSTSSLLSTCDVQFFFSFSHSFPSEPELGSLTDLVYLLQIGKYTSSSFVFSLWFSFFFSCVFALSAPAARSPVSWQGYTLQGVSSVQRWVGHIGWGEDGCRARRVKIHSHASESWDRERHTE